MAPPERIRKTTSAVQGTFPRKSGSLIDHLGAANDYARLADQARRLRHLQTLLDAVLPAYLLPGTRVANLKRGIVVIHADSGAVAVKLRQLAPRLAESFNQQGQEVTGIQVRVQARRRSGGNASARSARQLGLPTRQALSSLAAGLEEDSPVKRALAKLLRN